MAVVATILVVERDSGVRAVVRRLLEAGGHAVIVAAGGQEAIRLAAEAGRLGLLVVEVELGSLDGFDVADALRAHQPGLPVVYLSGARSTRGMREGEALLVKPFLPRELLDAVARLLRRGPGR